MKPIFIATVSLFPSLGAGLVTREDKVSRTPLNAMQQKTVLSGLAVAGGKENKSSNRNLLGSYSTPTVCVGGQPSRLR